MNSIELVATINPINPINNSEVSEISTLYIKKMYLLLWGTFLSLCSILISPLVELLIYISCTITDYERQLCQDIRILKQELSQISMVDEFSEYARTERKINKHRKK